jgi:hypothetical protein
MERGRREAEGVLWARVSEAVAKCLELDRRMLDRVEANRDGERAPDDPDGFIAPAVWERYVAARRDLVDFTTASIAILAGGRPSIAEAEPGPEGQVADEMEERLVGSLDELAELEEKLAAYLADNLQVLGNAIEELTRNQTVFTRYAQTAPKPEPGYLNSQA